MRLHGIDCGLSCFVDGAGAVVLHDEWIDVVGNLPRRHRSAVHAGLALHGPLLRCGRPGTARASVWPGSRVRYEVIARNARLESPL